jgi:hypothetical protein
LINDFQTDDFVKALELAKEIAVGDDLGSFIYNEIFEPKAISILESPEFLSKSNEFNQRYQDLFNQAGTIYTRGVFNPTKADTSFSTLNKQGYFAGGHKVHLQGDDSSINYEELQEKMRIVHESIDSDAELKKLRGNLAKNAQTQALIELLENICFYIKLNLKTKQNSNGVYGLFIFKIVQILTYFYKLFPPIRLSYDKLN